MGVPQPYMRQTVPQSHSSDSKQAQHPVMQLPIAASARTDCLLRPIAMDISPMTRTALPRNNIPCRRLMIRPPC